MKKLTKHSIDKTFALVLLAILLAFNNGNAQTLITVVDQSVPLSSHAKASKSNVSLYNVSGHKFKTGHKGTIYPLIPCAINDQTLTAAPTNVCSGNASTITMGASENGIIYTLRNDANNNTVAGPTVGTGPAINFGTGNLTSTTTYNVLAETDKYSVYLNGSQAGFVIPEGNALDVTNNFTIEGWIKPDGTTGYSRLFNKSQSYALGLSNGQSNITFTRHNAGDYSVAYAFTTGQWYHIACTYVSGTVEFFVNGLSVGTVSGVASILAQNLGAQIGSESSGFHFFKGNIDNVRLWSSVRTQAEISANQYAYLSSTGNPTLNGSWWIIEGSGMAQDYSSHGNHATSLAGTWQTDAPLAACNIQLTTEPTVTVDPDNTITLTSAPATIAQSLCVNTPIVLISYSTTGATGATFSGLPPNIAGSWSSNVVEISGTPVTTGSFNYTVTLTGGCGTVTSTGSIDVSSLTTASCAHTNASCSSSTDGTASAEGDGGNGSFTYLWSNGQSNATATGLAIGTYTITVTSNGCTATCSTTVGINPDITLPVITCPGITTVEANTVGCSYSGSVGTATATDNCSTPLVSGPVPAGPYPLGNTIVTWTATDASGNTATCTQSVTVISTLAASASGTSVACFGGSNGSATVTASGGVAIIATNSVTYNYTGTIESFIVPSGVTSLTVEAIGAQGGNTNGGLGARMKGTFTVTPGQILNLVVGQQGIVNNCGGSGASGGGGGGSFVWSAASTILPMVAAGGGGGGNTNWPGGCIAGIDAVITPDGTQGSGGLSALGGVAGNGGAGNAPSGTGSGGAGWLSAGQNSTYGSGCTGGLPPLLFTGGNGAIAFGPGGTGGFGGGGGAVCGCGGGGGYSGGGGGEGFTCRAGGGGGGSYNAGSSQVNTAGFQSGNGQVMFSWNADSYIYLWSNGQTTATATGLTAGTYIVTVTDNNGCTKTASYTLTEPTALVAAVSGTAVSCNGGSNGTATASASGGAATFTKVYLMKDANLTHPGFNIGCPPNTKAYAQSLTGPDYGFVWLDQLPGVATVNSISLESNFYLNCNGYTPRLVTLNSNASGTINLIGTNCSGCASPAAVNPGNQNGGIPFYNKGGSNTMKIILNFVNFEGLISNPAWSASENVYARIHVNASLPVTYSWNTIPVQTTATATGLAAGTYTVTVTDMNGCTATASYTITEPTVVTASASGTNISCKGGNNGTVSASAGGGNSPYTYMWNTGTTGSTASSLYPGTYTCTVTDANGCTKTTTVSITQPATLLTVTTTKSNVRCGGKSTGKITITPSGGTLPYMYAWSNGAGNVSQINNLAAGTYTVTVTDGSGCVKVKAVVITQNAPLTLLVVPGPNAGEATANAGGGVPAYNYYWNTTGPQTTATATGLLNNTTYKVKVTDSKNCTKTATIILSPGKSINTANAEFEIAVHPNPTNGIVNLLTNCTGCDLIEIKIYDALGKVIMNEKRNVSQLQFDLSTYEKGLYLFEVMAGDKRKTIRVLVQ